MSCCCCCCCCKCTSEDEDVDEEEESGTNRNDDPQNKLPDIQSVATLVEGEGGDQVVVVNPNDTKNTAQGNIAVYEGDDSAFNDLLLEAEAAIENGIFPQRIDQGSSGSYFVKNSHAESIGVFKPKDEEPYGKMNPKWAKWFQRRCCPCCFGRGCLVPNSGYLSEAGASLVDLKLGLNVVPKTKVIRMASSTFHYGKIKRETAKAKKTLANRFPTVGKRFHRIGLPLKTGSFQVFVKGYKDAILLVQQFESEPLPEDVAKEFQLEFEKLVMLDYIIRNTDRGHENWLIRYDKDGTGDDGGIRLSQFSYGQYVDPKTKCRIKIAAIDNGLAFPFKHPDEWRAYPFRWAKLPFAKIPFSQETRDKFLPILSNITLIEEICCDLYYIFSMDKNFKKSLFEKQMSVFRGQILNLVNALRDGKSPLELVQMPPVRVFRALDIPSENLKHQSTCVNKGSNLTPRTMKISPTNTLMFDGDEYKPEFQQEGPVFRSW